MRCYRAASRQRKRAFVSQCLDDLALEDPRCPLADLATRKDAGTDRAQDRHLALCENRGRLLETQLAACRSFAVTVNCDLVLIAEGPDSGLGPAVAAAGPLAGTVQDSCNRPIRHEARKSADQLAGLGVGGPAMLAGLVFTDAQLGVVATLPVQHESDLVLLNTGDDLVQHRAENAFARRRARVWVVPAAVEVSAQFKQPAPLLGRHQWLALRIELLDPLLELIDDLQPLVPTPFELGGHQAVLGIDRVVLAPSPSSASKRACSSASIV